jgi:2-dehydro-3-deoxyphosphogluconate aldolase/(4S)-4-hydroxy-2-oxoglutarate aldolase
MTRDQVRERIRSVGIIPAVRVATAEEARFAVEAIAGGGIPIVEITMTVRGALEVIADLVASESELIVGAGTVLNVETVAACIDAGAHFITSPSLKATVVEESRKRGITVIPGAMTPTEVSAAWDLGADFIKIFPCAQIGGPNYIRALRRPFPDVPLIAAGGVNQNSAADFIRSGADVLGVGTGLVSADALNHHESKRIRELARRYVAIVMNTREEMSATRSRTR